MCRGFVMSSAVEASLTIREQSEGREPNSKRFLHSGRNDRSLHRSAPSSVVRLAQSLDGSRLVGLRSKTSLNTYLPAGCDEPIASFRNSHWPTLCRAKLFLRAAGSLSYQSQENLAPVHPLL